MPRMTEIVGESQNAGPDLFENDLMEDEQDADPQPHPKMDESNQPGAIESPLELRLTDFSGEGERAPPI